MKTLAALLTTLFLFVLASFPQSTSALQGIIALDDCMNAKSPLCTVSFTLDQDTQDNMFSVNRNETITLDKSWSQFLAHSTNNNIVSLQSTKGRCELNIETDVLTIYPQIKSDYAVCVFEIVSNTSVLGVQMDEKNSSGENFTLPPMVYYEAPFEFIPYDQSCMDPYSRDICNGQFNIPLSATVSTIIKSTSVVTTNDPVVQIDFIDSTPLGPTESVYTYKISFKTVPLDSTMLLFEASLEPSYISPFLEFYTTNGVFLGNSETPLWSDIPSLDLGLNCNGRRDNLCTIAFEVNRYLPHIDELRLTPISYLKPNPTDEIHECTGKDQVILTTGRDENHIMLCQTFRKTIHTTQDRASLNNQLKMSLNGRYIKEVLTYSMSGVYYFSPIWVEWDEASCADPTIPVCTAIVKSTYNHGPAIGVEVFLPFSKDFDRVECNTNLLSVTGDRVDLPSKHQPSNPLSYIELTEETPLLICNVYFVIGYKTEYIYNNIDGKGTNIPIVLESYQEGVDPVIREGFGAAIIIPDRENLQFNAFPLIISPQDDCSLSLLENCTIDFIIPDPSKLHKENYFRSFVIDVPGLDEEYTLVHGGYSLELTNFISSVSTVITYPLKANTDANPTAVDRFGFEIGLTHHNGLYVALDDTQPMVVSLKYRKAPDQILNNQVPRFINYGGIPLGEQPPQADLLPSHPDGFTVVFQAVDTPLYQRNCDDARNQFCTVHLTRRSEGHPFTYFDFFFTDSTTKVWNILELTAYDDNMLDFITTPIFLEDGTMQQMVDWNQFKKDPLDETEPLPTFIILHLLKPLGHSGTFSIIVYPDSTDEPLGTAPTSYLYEKDAVFNMDGQPIFDEDCSSFTSPYCSLTYTIYSTVIPNSYISIHEIQNDILHSVEVIECQNVDYIYDEVGVSIPPFAITLSKNGDQDHFNTIHPSDFISFYSLNDFKTVPIDSSLPIKCKARYILENKVSRVRHRISPYRIMDQDQQMRTDFNLQKLTISMPRLAWAPVIVQSLQDCYTSAIFTSTCTLRVDFFGTKVNPLRQLSFDLPPTFPHHPFIPDAIYDMFLSPMTKAKIAAAGSSQQAYVVGQFHLGLNPDKGVREFKFSVFDVEYQQKQFQAFLVFENVVQDKTLYYPSFSLPVIVNNVATIVHPVLSIPAIIGGPIISVYHNQSIFSGPGFVKTTMKFNFEVTEMKISTDFGNNSPIPCIQEYSSSIISTNSVLRPEQVNYSIFKQIIDAGIREGAGDVERMKTAQIAALENFIKAGAFNYNNEPISPQILGWFNPYKKSEQLTRWTPNRFGDSVSYAILDQTCDYFTRVDMKYPTERNNVQHSISVSTPRLTTDVLYLFQYYPGYQPSAYLRQPDSI